MLGTMQWWVHEDDGARAKEVFERTFREASGGKDFEYKAVKKNGELWYASSSWETLKNSDGLLKGVVMQTVDITERKQGEEKLRASEERFRTIFETAQDLIFLKDHNLKFTAVNPAMERYYGVSASELIGKTNTSLLGRKVGRLTKEEDLCVLGGEVIDTEHSFQVQGKTVIKM